MNLKVEVSFAKTEEEALQGAYDQWRSNIFTSSVLTELRTAKQLQEAAQVVKKEIMREHVLISTDLGQYQEWLQQYIDLGFTQLILHNVNLEQERFIDVFGEKVLPQLAR